jgi:serine/threonine protein kinase
MQGPRFLRFAVGTAVALSRLDEKELIHKDVKPANVLVSPATGQARLIGFGIASRLPRERQGARTSRVHSRNTRLHGPRTDRANESLARFAERPLCARGWRFDIVIARAEVRKVQWYHSETCHP